MLYTEFLSNNRIHTYSDTFKIRQLDTDIIYDDAIDIVSHEYEETDIPLDDVELTDEDALKIITGVSE